MLNDWAPQTKHTVTFSGGGENSKFYASLGHIYQNSLYKNDNYFMKRTNFRLSVETGLRDLGLTFRGAFDGYRQHNQHQRPTATVRCSRISTTNCRQHRD